MPFRPPAVDPARPWFRWWAIIGALLVGTANPLLHYTLLVCVGLGVGYAACRTEKRAQRQLLLAYLFGGLSTGAGFSALMFHDLLFGAALPRWLPAVVIWLGARVAFLWLEARFALIRPVPIARPAARVEPWQDRSPCKRAIIRFVGDKDAAKVSAWGGDYRGRTVSGSTRWSYWARGEIAMGGPTYGDVLFSQGVALRGVGPSIAVSEDGAYAALPLPSRETWGLWLVDLEEHKLYELSAESRFWELDGIAQGVIHGRNSPLTDDTPFTLEVSAMTKNQPAVQLVREGAFWLHPSQREPEYLAELIAYRKQEREVAGA